MNHHEFMGIKKTLSIVGPYCTSENHVTCQIKLKLISSVRNYGIYFKNSDLDCTFFFCKLSPCGKVGNLRYMEILNYLLVKTIDDEV